MSKNREDNSAAVTVVVCVVAGLLAIAPVFIYGRKHVEYDPTLAIYTVTFMGIAAYTFFQRKTLLAQSAALTYAREHDLRLRKEAEADTSKALETRRANLATALLTELMPLVKRLERIVADGPDAVHQGLPHPLVDEALRHTELFDRETVHSLASFAFRLWDVEIILQTFREQLTASDEKTRHAQHVEVTTGNTNEVRQAREYAIAAETRVDVLRFGVKVQARAAHQKVIPLVAALRAAGGMNPQPELERQVARSAPLTMLPNPFDQPASNSVVPAP